MGVIAVEELSSRERVLLAIDRKETDRLPIDFGGRVSGIALSTYEEVKKLLGFEAPTRAFNNRLQTAEVDEGILELFRVDTRHIHHGPAVSWDPQRHLDGSWRDEWGIRLIKPESSYYYDYAEAPLGRATIADLDGYAWPNGNDLSRCDGKLEEAKAVAQNGKYALFTGFKGIFERAWALRGMQQFFMDMVLDREFAEALLDKVLQVQKEIYGPFLRTISPYLDVVCFTEDMGTQVAPLISPRSYRELIKPRHREWVSFIKEITSARVALHCCGQAIEFLDDAREVGIDLLNPVQVTATGMEPEHLKAEYGGDFCFWGGLDTQQLLPTASPDEVEREVTRISGILGKGGGYIFAPVHNIQPFTPAQNVVKMFEVARTIGA